MHTYGNTSSGEQFIPQVHLAVVSCCSRMASSNSEGGIGKAEVCNSWKCVSNVVSPPIGHALLRRLWVYEACEIHSGSNEVWTIGRICDHSHCVHGICGGDGGC